MRSYWWQQKTLYLWIDSDHVIFKITKNSCESRPLITGTTKPFRWVLPVNWTSQMNVNWVSMVYGLIAQSKENITWVTVVSQSHQTSWPVWINREAPGLCWKCGVIFLMPTNLERQTGCIQALEVLTALRITSTKLASVFFKSTSVTGVQLSLAD